jgi:hypothetical protein
VRGVGDDRVDVPEQQKPPRPDEHGSRSTSASSGSSAAHTDAHSSAACTSPDGEDTATSASSCRRAVRAIASAASVTHGSTPADATGEPRRGAGGAQ